MEVSIYYLTSFLIVTISQYRKVFGLPATSLILLVPDVNNRLIAIDSRALSILVHYISKMNRPLKY